MNIPDTYENLFRRSKNRVTTALIQTLWNSRLLRGQKQFRFYTRGRYLYHRTLYDAPANPYKSIRVDPETVDYHNGKIKREWGLGQISDGDWDSLSNCIHLKKKWVYTGLKQRFGEGYDWEQTVYYERAKTIIDEDGSLWGYEDIEHFRESRCEYVDGLFDRINREGYRPNYEGGHEVPYEHSTKMEYNPYVHRLEPLVVIGRNGEIYWRDGYHRLAIAEILGLGEIPVNVLARHSKWQRIRDRLETADSVSELSSAVRSHVHHADVQDIVDGTESDPISAV